MRVIKSPERSKKVLAIASGGGHWVQLLRLRPSISDLSIVWATVQGEYREQVSASDPFYIISDATRWSKFALLRMAAQVLYIIIRERPNVVLTTGAAPGLAAIIIGKILGARTVWVDSIANIEGMSMSGMQAKRWADLWLTQWEHLALPDGPKFMGAVL